MMKRIVFATLIFSILMMSACKKDKDTDPEEVYSGISLEEYINQNYINLTPIDESGVYVIITDSGTGAIPSEGDLLYCYYKGFYLDGTPFDTLYQRPADEDLPDYSGRTPYPFTYLPTDTIKHIAGWYKGFGQLKRGSKATFLLPADQAYGEKGKKPILPYTPLRFDVELINDRK